MQPAALIAYIDVDDTLVRSVGTKRIPMPATIAHVRHLHEHGATLLCWSAGGADTRGRRHANSASRRCSPGSCRSRTC